MSDTAPSPRAALDDLSPRELDVLRLVALGYSNREIADALFLGINTIKTYIRTTYRTIGVTRRSQAVVWALLHVPPEDTDVAPKSTETSGNASEIHPVNEAAALSRTSPNTFDSTPATWIRPCGANSEQESRLVDDSSPPTPIDSVPADVVGGERR